MFGAAMQQYDNVGFRLITIDSIARPSYDLAFYEVRAYPPVNAKMTFPKKGNSRIDVFASNSIVNIGKPITKRLSSVGDPVKSDDFWGLKPRYL